MDWILSITTVIGMILIGYKSNKGHVVLILNQGLWAWFAISTENHGLLPLTVILFFVYLRNWWVWRKEDENRLWDESRDNKFSPFFD